MSASPDLSAALGSDDSTGSGSGNIDHGEIPFGFDPKHDCLGIDWEHPTGLNVGNTGLCGIETTKFKYVPTRWIGALFLALYLILTLAHVLQAALRWKRAGFMILAALCALVEMAGWVARFKASSNPWSKGSYIAQMVCLILAPVFVSAANYVNFEKMQEVIGHELSRLTPSVYFTVFLTGDIVSLLIQAIGGGLSAKAKDDKALDRGTNIMIAGVSFQILVTVPFTILFVDFHIRHYFKYQKEKLRYAHHLGGYGAQNTVNGYGEKSAGGSPWTGPMIRLSAASFLSTMMILIRCIYRMAEMIDGWHSKLATTEIYFVILDATLIFISLVVFNIIHPGWCFGNTPATPAKNVQLDKGISHAHMQQQNGAFAQGSQQGHYAKGSDQVWNINSASNPSYVNPQDARNAGMYNLQTSSQTHVSHTHRHNGSETQLPTSGGAQQNYGGYAHRYQNSEVSLLGGSNVAHQNTQHRYQNNDSNLNQTNIYGGRYQGSETNLVGSSPPADSPISGRHTPSRQASYNQNNQNQWQYPTYDNSHVQQTQGSTGRRTPVGYR